MKRALGLITLLVAVILILRPLLGRLHGVAMVFFPWLLLPARLRVAAAVLAVLAVLALFGVCPRLRAAWHRWLSGLGIVLVFLLLVHAVGPSPSLDFWRAGYGVVGDWGITPIWSRPISSRVSN